MLCKIILSPAFWKYTATINGLLLQSSVLHITLCKDQIQLDLLFLTTRWGCSRAKYSVSIRFYLSNVSPQSFNPLKICRNVFLFYSLSGNKEVSKTSSLLLAIKKKGGEKKRASSAA